MKLNLCLLLLLTAITSLYGQSTLKLGPEIDIYTINRNLLVNLRVFVQIDCTIKENNELSNLKLRGKNSLLLVFFRPQIYKLQETEPDLSNIQIGIFHNKYDYSSTEKQIGINGYIYVGFFNKSNILHLNQCYKAYDFIPLYGEVVTDQKFIIQDKEVIKDPWDFEAIDIDKEIKLYRIYKAEKKTNLFILSASFNKNVKYPTEYYMSDYSWDLADD